MSGELERRALKVIAEFSKAAPGELTLETSFEQLGIDSLGTVALVYDLEEEFEVSIPNDEAQKIRTVREAVESLSRNLTRPGGGAGGLA
jgi:acyl carrier protein